MITSLNYNLEALLDQTESEFLDFKKCHHRHKVDLIHDILCLANSPSTNDRFLIFGVKNNRELNGCLNDEFRKTQANIIDALVGARLNTLPSVRLDKHEVDGLEIDVLIVLNKPEKPYYLLEDQKINTDVKVRAGAIYSRSGDNNTPKDRTVDDKKLEHMFKERFQLDRSPSQRLKYLLQDLDQWKYYDRGEHTVFYNEMYPEFRIKKIDSDEGFEEPWIGRYPNPKVYKYDMVSLYYETIIHECMAVSLDGGRIIKIVPEQRVETIGGGEFRTYYYYVESSISYLIEEMMNKVYPQSARMRNDENFNYFNTKDEALMVIGHHLKGKAKEQLIYFESESDTNKYVRKYD